MTNALSFSMRDATRSAMRLFGWLLAEDVSKAPTDTEWSAEAETTLSLLDKLDAHGDEETDRALEELTRSPGAVWLRLAEDGFFEDGDYVGHVLHHFSAGGYPGPPWVQNQLSAIGGADEDSRDAIAMGLPELVGLMRAVMQVPDGLARLVAVMDRK